MSINKVAESLQICGNSLFVSMDIEEVCTYGKTEFVGNARGLCIAGVFLWSYFFEKYDNLMSFCIIN